MTAAATLSISALRARFDGRVVAPGDESYDATRAVFSGAIDRRPAAIVMPADAAEVAEVVSLARETGVVPAVRSGGHSTAGHAVVDDGLVLDLSALRDLEINVEGRTAWAGSGLTTGDYTTAVGEHGLATGFGDTAEVGIGGITVGGGVGFLVRKHGLTIDNLLGAEIVTADGQVRQVDADNHPDLFWAIRGGGGNFGVVTRFRYRMHEVPSIVGGMLVLPGTPDLITGFVKAAEAAPDELSTIANVMSAPPLPLVPSRWHGRIVVMASVAYAGDTEAGERALAPLRALAEPIVDMVRPMLYSGLFQPAPAGFHPIAAGHTLHADRVDHDTAEMLVEQLSTAQWPVRIVQLRVLGGAMARVPADATAYAHRSSRIMLNVTAAVQGVEQLPEAQAWVDRLAGGLHTGDNSVYVNFLGDEDETRLREAYPGRTWDRLVEIKQRYDPTNLFRHNHNIRPATG